MLDITYSITGVTETIADLQRIRLDAIRPDIQDILDEMAGDAANYPSQPPSSTYVRTGDLGRGWTDSMPTIDLSSDTLVATLTNSTPYGIYVQGSEDQAKVHQGRWRTADKIMDEWEARVVQAVESGLDRILPR